MGRDLQEIKPLAEQIYTLAAEMLRLVDMEENERRQRIEELKKTAIAKLFAFLAWKICLKMRISKRRTATVCVNLNTAMVALRYVAKNEKTERKGGFTKAEFT